MHRKYGITPLRTYLESERISLQDLKWLVRKLGSAVKKPFQESLDHFAREIKKAPAEYYDDLCYFRGRVFRPLDRIFSKFDAAAMPVRQLNKPGLDTRKIHVDVQDRPKKTPSAVAFFVQTPNERTHQETRKQTGRRVVGLAQVRRLCQTNNEPGSEYRPRRVLTARHWTISQTLAHPIGSNQTRTYMNENALR